MEMEMKIKMEMFFIVAQRYSEEAQRNTEINKGFEKWN